MSVQCGPNNPKKNIIQGLAYQSAGLIAPIQLQREINTSFVRQLELSRHKEVEATDAGAVNDLHVDTTENRYLLSGYSDGSIAVHDLHDLREDEYNNGEVDSLTYKLVCTVSAGSRYAHKRSIETVQWYPLDTGIFTSSGTDRVLKIWDANRLQTAEEYSFNGIVHCHHMSPVATRHTMVAVGTDSSVVKLVDPRAGSATHSLRGHKEGAVRAVQWSNKDEFILATGGIDNFAMLWDVRTAKGCLMKMQDNKKKSGYHRNTTHDGSVNGVEFTPDGHHLLTIGTDQKMYAWDTSSGKKLAMRYPTLSHIKRRSVKFCLTKSGSENFLFIPTGSSITSFGLVTPSRVQRLYGHYNNVNCTVFHADGQQMLSGGNDHKILVWSVRGDLDYSYYVNERRALAVEKMARQEAAAFGSGEQNEEDHLSRSIVNFQVQPHTLDTWSDDDEDDTEQNDVRR
ncbi:DNA excision repair protein ercc-8 [Plakobranchus ocellatus]|uniref:DNA excision repair protein ercc-8 n=1 Tax=Plakobranchus ocellatus TaxID=259542 RepID=A0AAV4AE66_9GAST|nr:DNA excision repair protein ercc-8 [Plakobranchus ocellatus]